ncbi:hypothetical protein ACJJJB_00255 (plasmid) [Microbulbifer sp. ANSA001]|uniref:hypothetical protein n=1 Tax=Microbulbifer sp. ANSA001 TaxID=3243358 RepID=UPI0040418714
MSNSDYTTLRNLPVSHLRRFARSADNRLLLGAYLAQQRPYVRAMVHRAASIH